MIFECDEFNNLRIDEFSKKLFHVKHYTLLLSLKRILEYIIFSCKFQLSMLDSRGNKIVWNSLNEKRGNKPYYPPIGCIGIGLRVIDKYDEDNKLIGKNNLIGEWCIAYHEIGLPSDKINESLRNIIKGGLKEGKFQIHSECEDIYHSGKKVGNGVYFTCSINTAEKHATITVINGKKCKIALMVRVKPDAIRHCSCTSDYWVVNGDSNEIRFYRILYKEIDNNIKK